MSFKEPTIKGLVKEEKKEQDILKKIISNNPLEDIGLYKEKDQGPMSFKKVTYGQTALPDQEINMKCNTSAQFINLQSMGLRATVNCDFDGPVDATGATEAGLINAILLAVHYSTDLQIVAGKNMYIIGKEVSIRKEYVNLMLCYESPAYEDYRYMLPKSNGELNLVAREFTGPTVALLSGQKQLYKQVATLANTVAHTISFEIFIPIQISHPETAGFQNNALWCDTVSSIEFQWKVGSQYCFSKQSEVTRQMRLQSLTNISLEYLENRLTSEQYKIMSTNTYIQKIPRIREIAQPLVSSQQFAFNLNRKETYKYLLFGIVWTGTDTATSSVGAANATGNVIYNSYGTYYNTGNGAFLSKKNSSCLPFEISQIEIDFGGDSTLTYDAAAVSMFQRLTRKPYLKSQVDELNKYIVKIPLTELPFNNLDEEIVPGTKIQSATDNLLVRVDLNEQVTNHSLYIKGLSPVLNGNSCKLACVLVGEQKMRIEMGRWMTM